MTTSSSSSSYRQIDPNHLGELMKKEEEIFEKLHPKSKILYEEAKKNFLCGVPMVWMIKWAGKYPLFVQQASGAHFKDMDNNEYIDFCLGDTGAMTGHSPQPTVKAIQKQVEKGITFMLPIEESIWVGKELEKRFGLTHWQFTLTATDANMCDSIGKNAYQKN